MKKKGFTLIELLSVIVILAIISLIAVPIVLGVIDKAKKGAFKDSVKIANNQIEMYLFKNGLSKIPTDGVNIKDLDIKSDFTSGKFVEEDGVITAHFIKNKDYCAYGPVDNLLIKKDCNDLDISYPVIDESKLTTTRTSNSITVIINEGFATDEESGIVSYEINIYDGASKKDWETLNEIGNVTFNKLTNGKEYKIEVIVKNGNDMTSTATKEVETVTVDVPTYSLNPSSDEKEWASSRTVTINYPSGYTNEYSIDGGLTWTPYTSPIEFTESGSIIARVFDGENYITGSNQTVAQVDSDKPTSSTFTYTRTSKSITITASGTDATSNIVGYAFSKDNGSTWTSKQTSNEYTFNDLTTGTYKVIVRVYDQANNYLDSSVQSIETIGIDTPTYNINPSSGWATTKTVTINYPSGYTNEYSLDGGETWKTYSSPVEFTKTGTIIARVNDGKNYVTASSQTVAQVDSDKPTSSTFTYTRTSKSITITASGTDATSNIVGYAFSKDNGSTWTNKQTSNSYTFNDLASASYNIKVRVYDQANNHLDSSTQSIATVSIDKPTYSISPSGYSTSKTVTINYPSGYTNEYSLDGGETWKPYTGPITFNKNGTIIARVNDGKNYVTASSQTVNGIDNNKIVISSVSGASATWSASKNLTVYLDNVGVSMFKQVCYYISNSTTLESDATATCQSSNQFTITDSGKYIFFEAIGGSGIHSDIVGPYNLYVGPETPTAPVIVGKELSPSTFEVSLKDESLSSAGIDYYEYFIGGVGLPSSYVDTTSPAGTTTNSYTITIKSGEMYLKQIFYRAIDNNGNASELSNGINVTLDTVVPKLSSVTGTSTIWATSRTLKVTYNKNSTSSMTCHYYVSDSTTKPSTDTEPTASFSCSNGIAYAVTITTPGKYVYFKAVSSTGISSDWSSYYNLYVSS